MRHSQVWLIDNSNEWKFIVLKLLMLSVGRHDSIRMQIIKIEFLGYLWIDARADWIQSEGNGRRFLFVSYSTAVV